MVGRQVTFYATSDVYDIIKSEGIEQKKQSKWINDKIKKAVQVENNEKNKQNKVEKVDIVEGGEIEVEL